MTFFERYSELCAQRDLEPCSQRAASLFQTTRATISMWGKTNSIPRGETVKAIADEFKVSTDYLLGRTSDPTDYTDEVKRQKADAEQQRILDLYSQLDIVDRVRVESYIEGILTGDKYKKKTVATA